MSQWVGDHPTNLAPPIEGALARLHSPLHATLIHTVAVAADLLDADVSAGRLFTPLSAPLCSYVYSPRFPGGPSARADLQRWPFLDNSIFHQPSHGTQPQPLYLRRWDPDAQPDAMSPLDQYVTIRDVVMLGITLDKQTTAVLVLVRCDHRPLFNQNDLAALDALYPSICKALADGLSRQHLPQHPPDPFATLSPRETEIAKLLLHRKTEHQVADALGRSPHTVHAHIKSIYRKLNISRRRQLLELAKKIGMISPQPPQAA